MRVCVWCIYTIFISVLCVSREELVLIESNQRICELFIQCNTYSCNTYMGVSFSWPLYVLCVFVCVYV